MSTAEIAMRGRRRTSPGSLAQWPRRPFALGRASAGDALADASPSSRRKAGDQFTVGCDQLPTHLADYTPEWAEQKTGIPAKTIDRIAREFAAAKPNALAHPGWRASMPAAQRRLLAKSSGNWFIAAFSQPRRCCAPLRTWRGGKEIWRDAGPAPGAAAARAAALRRSQG